MKLLEDNDRLHNELRPLLRGYVHTYHYADLTDFKEEHKEDVYNHMLGSMHFNHQLFNELICADEYHSGIIAGYIKPQDAKADLMDRIGDVVFDTLNNWIQREYKSEMHSQSQRPDGAEDWDNEMAAQARDHNSSRGF